MLSRTLRTTTPAFRGLSHLRSVSYSVQHRLSLSTRSKLPLITSPYARNMSHTAESAERPQPDKVLTDIADYVHNYKIDSPLAFETARLCLIDTIGCGLEALRFEHCTRLLGPVVEGTVVPNGKKFILDIHDPLLTAVKVLEFRARTTNLTRSGVPSTLARPSDGLTLTTASWLLNVSSVSMVYLWCSISSLHLGGHPSDNLGAILAVADHLTRQGQQLTVRDILEGMIKAHEIQGSLALLNSFNRVGLDHVVLVKVASTAVVSKLLYVRSFSLM